MCEAEHVSNTADGLEAIIFTAEGDMRNALNNLQATHSGFGHVDQASVFKVGALRPQHRIMPSRLYDIPENRNFWYLSIFDETRVVCQMLRAR